MRIIVALGYPETVFWKTEMATLRQLWFNLTTITAMIWVYIPMRLQCWFGTEDSVNRQFGDGVWRMLVYCFNARRLHTIGAYTTTRDVCSQHGVYVLNHSSNLDWALVGGLMGSIARGRRLRIVALHNVFKLPVIGTILTYGKHIAFKPKSLGGRGREGCVADMKYAMLKGESVIVFPEGTRNPDSSTLREFKTGAFEAALLAAQENRNLEISIIPVAILGAREAAPPRGGFPPFTGKGDVRLVYLKPIAVPLVAADSVAFNEVATRLAAEARDVIQSRIDGSLPPSPQRFPPAVEADRHVA